MKKLVAFILAVLVPMTGASADLSLSQLVVELQAGKHASQDVEVANSGPDPAYVEVDPREIVAAGRRRKLRAPIPIRKSWDYWFRRPG